MLFATSHLRRDDQLRGFVIELGRDRSLPAIIDSRPLVAVERRCVEVTLVHLLAFSVHPALAVDRQSVCQHFDGAR